MRLAPDLGLDRRRFSHSGPPMHALPSGAGRAGAPTC